MVGCTRADFLTATCRHRVVVVPVCDHLGAVLVEVLNQVVIALSGSQFEPAIDGVEVAVILGAGELTTAGHQNGTEAYWS
jgi:hypothetical protein